MFLSKTLKIEMSLGLILNIDTTLFNTGKPRNPIQNIVQWQNKHWLNFIHCINITLANIGAKYALPNR
jgi:hypothetical protein